MVHEKREQRMNSTQRGEESEEVAAYKSSLCDLTLNSKPLINMLTMLADDYKDSAAPDIVKCIEQRLRQVTAEKKLPLLYLVDSICKNIRGIYVKLFTQNIVSNFCHVFEKADEKTRSSLYKLRQTWSVIFPAAKLYAVDVRIQRDLDPAWPVTAPKPAQEISSKASLPAAASKLTTGPSKQGQQQQVHINPKFLNDTKQPVKLAPPASGPAPEADRISAQLLQKQKELLNLQKQKMEMELRTQKAQLDEQARALREKEEKLKVKEQQLVHPPDEGSKKGKKRVRNRRSPSPFERKAARSPSNWVRNSGVRPNTGTMAGVRANANATANNRSRSRSPLLNTGFPTRSPQRSHRIPLLSKAEPKASLDQMKMASAVVPVPVPRQNLKPTLPVPVVLPPPGMMAINNLPGPSGTGGNMPINSSGPRVLALDAGPSMQSNQRRPPHSLQPPAQVMMNPLPWGQDRDYRRECEEADQGLRSGFLSSHDHDVLVKEMEKAMQENSKPSQETRDQELTMLVDGKSRKLYYLDESIAVILMNGPHNSCFDEIIKMDPNQLEPREISFEGKPTKVYIDESDEFVLLEFNNQPQTFFHFDHEQRIKFGGPAKEVILNGKAYQAKFGGPCFQVWFNGDPNKAHTLRLDGPPPRVKLSEQTRVDLWNQLVLSATKPHEVKPTEPLPVTASQPQNISDLFGKLVAAGFINNQVPETKPKPQPNQLQPQQSKQSTEQSLPENRAQANKEEERSPAQEEGQSLPPEPVLRVTPESLKISRPSLVAALYNGIQCTNCSLRFDDRFDDRDNSLSCGKTKYAKHLDWHFRQNRKDRSKPSASAACLKRNWYYSIHLWSQFKEVADEEENKTSNIFDSDLKDEDQEKDSEVTVPSNEDEALNHCAVCGEKFELLWFEDEEEWRLKNALSHEDGKTYHPFCLSDHEKQHPPEKESSNETNLPATLDEDHLQLQSSFAESPIEESSPLTPVKEETDDDKEMVVDTEVPLDEGETRVKSESTSHSADEEYEPMALKEEDIEPEKMETQEVIEYEIPLNEEPSESEPEENEVALDLETEMDITSAAGESNASASGQKEQSQPPPQEKNKMIVQQQRGIVFKMKASKLQASQPPVSPEPGGSSSRPESSENPTVIKGREESALCSIM